MYTALAVAGSAMMSAPPRPEGTVVALAGPTDGPYVLIHT